MRILMINKFLYPNGGSETYIFKLGEQLVKMGHEVQYFGMEHEGRCVGNHVNAYTSEMDFHAGNAVDKLFYSFKTIYSKEARTQIRKVLDDFQPEVCHLNNFNYQLTPSIILEIVKWRKEANHECHIVYTAHDYQLVCPNHMMNNPCDGTNCEKCLGGHFFSCTKGRCIHGSRAKSLIGSLEAIYWNKRKTYQYFDKIICCSEFLKSKLDTNPILKDKTIALHNFIDKGNPAKVAKKDYILYYGRLSKEKGIHTLIEVCKKLPDVRFVFAGTGPLESEIIDIKNIEYVGFKTGRDLERLIGEALFTICPSEWYENCPFSVMEPQMYGTPVVAANIGGIPELVKDGVTGVLFESGNMETLQEKITSLLHDRDYLERLSSQCNGNEFDDIEQYYESIIKNYY